MFKTNLSARRVSGAIKAWCSGTNVLQTIKEERNEFLQAQTQIIT